MFRSQIAVAPCLVLIRIPADLSTARCLDIVDWSNTNESTSSHVHFPPPVRRDLHYSCLVVCTIAQKTAAFSSPAIIPVTAPLLPIFHSHGYITI